MKEKNDDTLERKYIIVLSYSRVNITIIANKKRKI
jgi:hypothetical protein